MTEVLGSRPSHLPGGDFLPTLSGGLPGANGDRRTRFLFSLLLHTGILALLLSSARFLPYVRNGRPPADWSLRIVEIEVPACVMAGGCGGGGGNQEPHPASHGVLPRVSSEQFTLPTTHAPEQESKLMMKATVVGAQEMPKLEGQVGDPLSSVIGLLSDGRGRRGGIGDNCCGGIGRNSGPGAGIGNRTGVGYRPVTGNVRPPRLVYSPEPEYSAEARQVRHQGTVILWVGLGADGRVHDMRLRRSLGMGLDEQAMKAVREWRFDPARIDGQPVAVQIEVQVNFRLY